MFIAFVEKAANIVACVITYHNSSTVQYVPTPLFIRVPHLGSFQYSFQVTGCRISILAVPLSPNALQAGRSF